MRRRSGLTLAEVLVTALIFSLLLVIVVGLQASMSRLSHREDLRDEAHRNVNQGLAHLEELLLRSRVLEPAPGSLAPTPGARLQTGDPARLDAAGLPILEDITLTLTSAGDLLQVDAAGRPRRVASLGPAGQSEFAWLPNGLLRVTLRYARTPGKIEAEASQEWLLPNQSI